MKRLLASLLLGLTACASPYTTTESAAPKPECSELQGVRLCLADQSDGPTFSALQSTRVKFGDVDETLILQLESNTSSLRLAGHTPFGQTLVLANYVNGRFDTSGPAADRLDARLLMAIIQLSWWPLETLRQAHAMQGLDVEESAQDSQPRERRLMRNGINLLRIVYGNDHDVRLLTPGLELDVQTLEWAP